MFSAKHSSAEIKECQSQTTEIYQHAKWCLWGVLFFWGCFRFFSLFLFLFEKPPKGNFPVILELFPSSATRKGLSFKSFSSSYCVFFLVFPFVCPFKFLSIFFAFCPSTPLWKTLLFGVVLQSFFLLPFPLLMFACFFETNFPEIPFFKTNLL